MKSADQKVVKSGKQWYCKYCDYLATRADHYTKHISTVKHKKMVNMTKYDQNMIAKAKYVLTLGSS